MFSPFFANTQFNKHFPQNSHKYEQTQQLLGYEINLTKHNSQNCGIMQPRDRKT